MKKSTVYRCFQKEKLVSGPSKTGPLEGFVTNYNESCISHDGIVSEAQWITFNGWEYRPNGIVLLKHSFDTVSGLPEFPQINKCSFITGIHIFF